MHKLVIKSRFRFFQFWEKISIFDFEYENRPSLGIYNPKENPVRMFMILADNNAK